MTAAEATTHLLYDLQQLWVRLGAWLELHVVSYERTVAAGAVAHTGMQVPGPSGGADAASAAGLGAVYAAGAASPPDSSAPTTPATAAAAAGTAPITLVQRLLATQHHMAMLLACGASSDADTSTAGLMLHLSGACDRHALSTNAGASDPTLNQAPALSLTPEVWHLRYATSCVDSTVCLSRAWSMMQCPAASGACGVVHGARLTAISCLVFPACCPSKVAACISLEHGWVCHASFPCHSSRPVARSRFHLLLVRSLRTSADHHTFADTRTGAAAAQPPGPWER